MKAQSVVALASVFAALICNSVSAMPVKQTVAPPSKSQMGILSISEPYVLSYSGDTTWVQVHTGAETCPGDPSWGHGGEARGGPGPLHTWCFEAGPGDSCGDNPPWDENCFTHVDVRREPSQMGINYWHLDTYRTDQRPYCGNYALWCGSSSTWNGQAVECGTWASPPGYGNWWNCVVQLTLPQDFQVVNGCIIAFDPRYDTECNYDFFYVDYWNGTAWVTLATFNATSNNPGPGCAGPDFWGNSDEKRLERCDWQERSVPDEPAFKVQIPHASLIINSGPKFRWRFFSDASYSDADGAIDTDGGAFIDNVRVVGDAEEFTEDFESGTLDPTYWSLPDPSGVADAWHIRHDADPPYEGGDGGTPVWWCQFDSSFTYRARPEAGYPATAVWRNGWYYRLLSPTIPVLDMGNIVQFDLWCNTLETSCDHVDMGVRFFDADYGMWCPWEKPWAGVLDPNCLNLNSAWWFDETKNVGWFAPANADSFQFAWDLYDYSKPGDFCRGRHAGTEMLVDNVSFGFFEVSSTDFSARASDLLHDTFFTGDNSICAYNASFDAYDDDTLELYRVGGGNQPLPRDKQLVVHVADRDGVKSVRLCASIDRGAIWSVTPMDLDVPDDPDHPELGGDFYGTVCPSNFGLAGWQRGTEVWYYVRVIDTLDNVCYFPPEADPWNNPSWSMWADDYFTFSILPLFPDTYTGSKVLVVDGYGREVYDLSPCVTQVDRKVQLESMYEQVLRDAGYCFDKYDIGGSGSTDAGIHPIWLDDYDAVMWFTGTYYDQNLFSPESQQALLDYLGAGGKVVLCGDRIAYCMAPQGRGEDALGGRFLGGIMGATYLYEMLSPTDDPYIRALSTAALNVLGSPVVINLDSLLVARSCPYLHDLSFVVTNPAPPLNFTAERLLFTWTHMSDDADEAIYTEYLNAGQCVYVNFDLCASANHERTTCSGDAHAPAPDYWEGVYDGRVELVRVILEDVFGLTPSIGGQAGVSEPKAAVHRWALWQNAPNPLRASTEIRYEVAAPGAVTIRIFNATGRLVETLVNEVKQPGYYSAWWDGTNSEGERASSGVYFCRMEGGGFCQSKKMLLVD